MLIVPRVDSFHNLHDLLYNPLLDRSVYLVSEVPARAAAVLHKLRVHRVRDPPGLRGHVPLHEHPVRRVLPPHRATHRPRLSTQVLQRQEPPR